MAIQALIHPNGETSQLELQQIEECCKIKLLSGEYWWGGHANQGTIMPYDSDSDYSTDLGVPDLDDSGLGLPSNQVSPILISSRGRFIYSEKAFSFSFKKGILSISGEQVYLGATGGGLRSAYLALVGKAFSPVAKLPAEELFSTVQYNTWIEMPYQPTQEKVLTYVRELMDSGMPPGVVMIDDNWASSYGTWEFDRSRFPNPKAMCEELHQLGFKVMLWLVPFISADTAIARELAKKDLLLKTEDGQVAIRRWWNGYSATLDISNPEARSWLAQTLEKLQSLGVDGFKFDAGDIRDYRPSDISYGKLTPAEFCESWARFACAYPFNEMRACWKNNGMPLAQRLEDKPPTWDNHGIAALIPDMIAQGLMGYPYSCPDMIGGGEINAMKDKADKAGVDQEFFIRYAQVATFSPMMQFSASPKRLLDDGHYQIIKKLIRLRQQVMPYILRLAKEASRSGEPIIRPMAYHCAGLDEINNQFFLGENMIVAPVLEKGATSRLVAIPAGKWLDEWGNLYEVEESEKYRWVEVETPIERIPYFQRQ